MGVLVSTWGRCPDPCLNASHLISSLPPPLFFLLLGRRGGVSEHSTRAPKINVPQPKNNPQSNMRLAPFLSTVFFSFFKFLLLKCFLFFHFFHLIHFSLGFCERTPQHEDETRSTLTSISMSNPVLHCPSLIGTCQAFLVIKSVREKSCTHQCEHSHGSRTWSPLKKISVTK